MKAVIYRKYGPPEVLKLKDIDKPVPGENEILVKVHASTVNRTDCAAIRAKPFIMRLVTGLLKPKKNIPGTDFAGEIEEAGKNVSHFKKGDRIFGFNDIGLCSHAGYLTIPETEAIAEIPENTTYEEAAASCEGVHYAVNFINKVDLKKGDKVLVNGATGAIGSAAVQILKYYGADITAVCGTKNIEIVKTLGASRVIDYQKEDFTQEIAEYKYIFDTVGKSSFFKCRHLLDKKGIYLSSELGYLNQNIFLSLFSLIGGNRKVRFPYPEDCRRSIVFIKKLIEEKSFIPLIDRTYSMDRFLDAYTHAESGTKTGNVILLMEH